MSDAIRERIMEIKGEKFTSKLFRDIKNSDAALAKMVKRGEIECVGKQKTGCGAALKIYIEVKLNELKPVRDKEESKYMVRKRISSSKDKAVIDNWREAFPNWFVFDFKAVGRTVYHQKD